MNPDAGAPTRHRRPAVAGPTLAWSLLVIASDLLLLTALVLVVVRLWPAAAPDRTPTRTSGS